MIQILAMNAELLLAVIYDITQQLGSCDAGQNYLIDAMCKLLDWLQTKEESDITVC